MLGFFSSCDHCALNLEALCLISRVLLSPRVPCQTGSRGQRSLRSDSTGSDFSSSSLCSIILVLILKHVAEAGGKSSENIHRSSDAQEGCSGDFLIFPFSRKEIEKNSAGHSNPRSENGGFIVAGDILLLRLLGRRGPKAPIHAR